MEYEVVEKDKGTLDRSSFREICDERNKRSWKMKLWSLRKENSTFDN